MTAYADHGGRALILGSRYSDKDSDAPVGRGVDLHFLDTGGDSTYNINLLNGTPTPTFTKDRSGDTVNLVASETVTITVLDPDGGAIESAAVRVEQDPSGTLISQGLTNASGIYTFTYTDSLPQDVFVKVRLKGWVVPPPLSDSITSGSGLSAGFTLSPDRVVNLP